MSVGLSSLHESVCVCMSQNNFFVVVYFIIFFVFWRNPRISLELFWTAASRVGLQGWDRSLATAFYLRPLSRSLLCVPNPSVCAGLAALLRYTL